MSHLGSMTPSVVSSVTPEGGAAVLLSETESCDSTLPHNTTAADDNMPRNGLHTPPSPPATASTTNTSTAVVGANTINNNNNNNNKKSVKNILNSNNIIFNNSDSENRTEINDRTNNSGDSVCGENVSSSDINLTKGSGAAAGGGEKVNCDEGNGDSLPDDENNEVTNVGHMATMSKEEVTGLPPDVLWCKWQHLHRSLAKLRASNTLQGESYLGYVSFSVGTW